MIKRALRRGNAKRAVTPTQQGAFDVFTVFVGNLPFSENIFPDFCIQFFIPVFYANPCRSSGAPRGVASL